MGRLNKIGMFKGLKTEIMGTYVHKKKTHVVKLKKKQSCVSHTNTQFGIQFLDLMADLHIICVKMVQRITKMMVGNNL